MAAEPAAPAAPSNQFQQFPPAAHPGRPLIPAGVCTVLLDWQRATIFRPHDHPRLQFVLTGPETDCLARWRLRNGRWTHLHLLGEQVWAVPGQVMHAADWRRRTALLAIQVEDAFALSVAGRLVTDISIAPLRHYCAVESLIGELCARCWRECRVPGPQNVSVIAGLAQALATQLLLAHFAPTRNDDAQQWLLLRTIRDKVRIHIESDLTANLSLEALAGVAGLSPSYFGQLFRAATGLPPLAYVAGARVCAARNLMRTGRHTATEVSHLVGFSTQQQMNDSFRRLLGTRPTDYLPDNERNHGDSENGRKSARWRFH